MALQHSLSSYNDHQEQLEDLLAQHIPSSITHLEQCIARAQSQIEHLNSVPIPRTELLTDFALARNAELDTDLNRIRNADLSQARYIGESFLLRLRESERRSVQQRQRLDALETRTTMSESICAEQMALNRELAENSIRTLRQFAEAERKRQGAVKKAYNRCDSLTRELDRCKSQRDQQEQTIGRMRENAKELNEKLASFSHHLNQTESEKNTLRLERDKFRGEADSAQTLLIEQENAIAGMRERETAAALELRQRDALVESLAKERAELEKEMMRTRKEYENLLVRQEHEAEKQLEEKRQEVIAEQRAKHRAEIEQLRLVIRQHKSDFEAAMQEALRETQKLASQREEYFNNWRLMEEKMDQYKQKLRSTLSRKMVAKCSELVRDLKEIGGDENGRVTTHTSRTLEPVENVAQRFLDEMASGRSE